MMTPKMRLYRHFNFYYCRWGNGDKKNKKVYTDTLISTIVDKDVANTIHTEVYTDTLISTIVDLSGSPRPSLGVYTDTLISTIVDTAISLTFWRSLYRHFNFYYCRFGLQERQLYGVYTDTLISTIVDQYLDFWSALVYTDTLISTIVDREISVP